MAEFSGGTRELIAGSSLFAVAVTVYLFQNPERGATTATILSLTLTIVSTALAIHAAHQTEQATSAHSYSAMSQRAKMWTAMVLAVALVVPTSAWVRNRWFSDRDVSFPGPVEVREDSPSSVTPDIASGWQAGVLVFTPTLAPVGELSDCVIPAVLRVEPKVDGRPEPVIAARHGVPVSVTIPDRTREVLLGLRLDGPGDQGCVVRVSFSRGELRR